MSMIPTQDELINQILKLMPPVRWVEFNRVLNDAYASLRVSNDRKRSANNCLSKMKFEQLIVTRETHANGSSSVFIALSERGREIQGHGGNKYLPPLPLYLIEHYRF